MEFVFCRVSGLSGLRWLLNSVETCVPLPARTLCHHFCAAQQRSVSPKKCIKPVTVVTATVDTVHRQVERVKEEPTPLYSGRRHGFYI